MPANSIEPRLDLLVVPFDVDRDDTPMARAPTRLLEMGLENRLLTLGYSTRTRVIAPILRARDKTLRVARIQRAVARAVRSARSRGSVPILLSGGCLTALGVSAGLRGPGRRVSLVWVDAHGDFNTRQTSVSGYWDGMALAAVCGRALVPVAKLTGAEPVACSRIAHLAGRDFDPPETAAFRRHRVMLLPPNDLSRPASRRRLRERVGRSRELYVHVDVDGIDPADAPAVRFPTPEGARLTELVAVLRGLPTASALTFSAMSFDSRTAREGERTLAACLQLVAACFETA